MSKDLPIDAPKSHRDQSAGAAAGPRSRMLPIWGWVLLAGYVAAVAYVRSIDGLDGAIANIITLVCTFLTCCALFVWFCFYSGFSQFARRALLFGTPAIIVAMLALFRIDGVGGGLIPEFRFRWAPRPDELLKAPELFAAHSAARPRGDEAPAAGATAAADHSPAANADGSGEPAGTDSRLAGESGSGQAGESAPKQAGPPAVDLKTTSPLDFPQFLGPNRSGWIAGPALDTDWSQHPAKLLWRQAIGAGWSAFSIVNGYAVTLEQRGEQELTTCYELLSGKPVWSHAEETRHETTLGGIGPRSTPTISDGRVYSLGATGILNCLDGATGELLWTHHLLEEYGLTPETDLNVVAWGRSASPLVVDGLVIVPAGGPVEKPKVSLVAFDKTSGAKIWEAGDDQIAFASPTLATVSGVRQILSVNEKTVTGHDPETGRVFWSFPWEGMSTQNANNSQPIVVSDNKVFVSKGYTGGSMLTEVDCDESGKWTTKKLWAEPRLMKTKFTNAIVRDGNVYGISDGTLECVQLDEGRRRWKHGRYGHGQILGVGDVLIVQAESGEVFLVAFDPAAHRELGRLAALDGKTWNNPALYGRYLLVRNGEEAACYELPLREPNSEPAAVSQR